MKVFNSKEAAEQYMSSHTLTFSTPDLTLKRFAFWLGDIVPDPDNKEETIPRLMNYIEERILLQHKLLMMINMNHLALCLRRGFMVAQTQILMLKLNFAQSVARKFLRLLNSVQNVVLIKINRILSTKLCFITTISTKLCIWS